MGLLNCSCCGSGNVTVHRKYGAYLHTTCGDCGLDSWPMVQKYLADQDKRREDRRTKEVEVIRVKRPRSSVRPEG